MYVCVYEEEQWQRAEKRLVYAVESNNTLLECVPRSLQAKVLWFMQRGGEKHEVSFRFPYIYAEITKEMYVGMAIFVEFTTFKNILNLLT